MEVIGIPFNYDICKFEQSKSKNWENAWIYWFYRNLLGASELKKVKEVLEENQEITKHSYGVSAGSKPELRCSDKTTYILKVDQHLGLNGLNYDVSAVNDRFKF